MLIQERYSGRLDGPLPLWDFPARLEWLLAMIEPHFRLWLEQPAGYTPAWLFVFYHNQSLRQFSVGEFPGRGCPCRATGRVIRGLGVVLRQILGRVVIVHVVQQFHGKLLRVGQVPANELG